jgi:hypothetical protein
MKPRKKQRGSRAATITLLGGGRLATALIEGLREAHYPRRIVVHDRNLGKLRAFRKRYAAQTEAGLERAVADADIILIAVWPESVSETVAELQRLAEQGALRPAAQIVSLAAGIPLAAPRASLAREIPIARAMPSPMCTGGSGLTALVFPAKAAKGERAAVHRFLGRFGPVVEIYEKHMDAFTACYSVSHGYHHWMRWPRLASVAGYHRSWRFLWQRMRWRTGCWLGAGGGGHFRNWWPGPPRPEASRRPPLRRWIGLGTGGRFLLGCGLALRGRGSSAVDQRGGARKNNRRKAIRLGTKTFGQN